MHRQVRQIEGRATGHTSILRSGKGRAKEVGRQRGGHGIANTKRGESFKEGLVICVTAPKIRLKEPKEEWVLQSIKKILFTDSS